MTYRLTERRLSDIPLKSDPLAQAFKRHSGVFDLRDALAGNVIVASSSNLRAIRQQQARLNTRRYLDTDNAD